MCVCVQHKDKMIVIPEVSNDGQYSPPPVRHCKLKADLPNEALNNDLN